MNRRHETARAVDQAEAGYFLLRLVKGGPLVAAQIIHEGGMWRAVIDGVPQLPGAADWTRAAGVERIWIGGTRCTAAEYAYRLNLKSWATTAAPSHPAAQPDKSIQLTRQPSIW